LSKKVTDFISEEELEIQKSYRDKVRTVLDSRYGDKKPLAYIHTYGCQGNVQTAKESEAYLKASVTECVITSKMQSLFFTIPVQ